MRTGDLVLMRDDGYLEIVGRIKDTIIKGVKIFILEKLISLL